MVELNVTVIGWIPNRAEAEFDVPVSVTGVFDADPAAWFVVEMTASLERGPIWTGAKRALKENDFPAARVNGTAGVLSITKLGLPEMLKLLTVVATLAVQLILVLII